MFSAQTPNLNTTGAKTPNSHLKKSSIIKPKVSLDTFQDLADSMPQLVWTADSNGKVDYYNNKWRDFKGINPTSSGFSWQPVVHPHDLPATLRAWESALKQGSVYQVEHRVCLRDGTYRWFLSRGVPKFNKSGQIVKWYGTATDINDTVLARQEVQHLYNHAPAGYHSLDSSGVVQKINDTELSWLGYERQEIVGKIKYPQLLTLKSQKIFAKKFSIFKKTGKIEGLELEIIKKDGSIFTGLINATAIYDQDGKFLLTQSTMFDITERQKIVTQIRQSELSFRTLADSMPQLVWTTNPKGSPLYYNSRFMAYTGLSSTKSLTRNWSSIIHRNDYPKAHDQWLKSFNQNLPYQSEFRLKSSVGKYRWFLARAYPLKDPQGQIIQWFGTCTDIHRQKRISQKKDEFLSIASHELKTPITSIKNYTQVLEQVFSEKGDLQSAHLMSHLNSQVQRLTKLVTDLLDSNKITSGKLEYNFENFDFNQMVTSVVDDLRHAYHHNQITLNLGTNTYLFGDPHRLSQVIINLVVNAIKFSSNDQPITISTQLDSDSVSLSVKDQGIGISAVHRTHLFKRFYRGVKASQTSGLGLGLYISSEIIKRHQGGISVKSKVNHGSTFTVSLPVPDTT
jgi:PAS domain S-box-containing protein